MSHEGKTRLYGEDWLARLNASLQRQPGFRTDMKILLGGSVGGGTVNQTRDQEMSLEDKAVFESAYAEVTKTHYFVPATFTEFRPAVHHFSHGAIDYRCRYAPKHYIATSGEARPTEHFWTIELAEGKSYRGPDWTGHELATDAERAHFEAACLRRVENQGRDG